MKKKSQFVLMLLLALVTACTSTKEKEKTFTAEQKSDLKLMAKVADWMKENRQETVGGRRQDWDWTNATWFVGVMELYKVSGEEHFKHQLLDVGDHVKWDVGPIRSFADDQCIGQVFCDLYAEDGGEKKLERLREAFDLMIEEDYQGDFTKHLEVCWRGEWSWCDSLFMGPPTLAKFYEVTGEQEYLDFMDKKFWRTYDKLYDKDEHLFFRDTRFITRKEANGEKVFWSRGNGWVMGGLVRILECLPKDYPAYPKYVKLYREMSTKIASLQQSDGFWRASLLDPVSFPGGEVSGTGFFCYALAWGVNNGYLAADDYLPVIHKSWTKLKSSVHDSGKLGWVQAIGADPRKTSYQDTEVYGVGAFLLAGSEVVKLNK